MRNKLVNFRLSLYLSFKKELIPIEDRGAYLIIGSTDEGSSFEYTQEKAQIIEGRILKLLQYLDRHILNL